MLVDRTQDRIKMIYHKLLLSNAIVGRGVINRGKETEKATASGSISGDQISLEIRSEGGADRYKFNLSLSSLAAGTYTACMADGSSRSGKVTFTVFA
ncbi:MAG: hypothetical protein PHS80_04115, partial [Methanothrix sp.]|nr:hypothetical protein [Methanothrix sp.]